ncbi:hypothetical protein [Phenylobacterium sp.]|uniref:hypothetical protein n=1 Tax=Phenylobacterium sp. TaxID=1871053 RepID=UPI00286CEF8B|nr:hypothetical protein [Phenylobacterium sp.]
MSALLQIVAQSPIPSASLSERVNQLQAEARGLAREHIDMLEASLLAIRGLAEEIAQGGEAYPPGVRDLARRLGEESAMRAQTIEAIMGRR